MIRLILLLFTILNILSCKTKIQTEYEEALNNGIQLLEQETIDVVQNEVVLFPFDFSDGVNPQYYNWQVYQQDSTVIRYIETQKFHFAPVGVDGGRAAGIHRYQVLKTGIHKLLFFIPSLKETPLNEEGGFSSYFRVKTCYIHVISK